MRVEFLRPRYHLRSLFVLILVASIPLALRAAREQEYRARRAALAALAAEECTVDVVIESDGKAPYVGTISDPSELGRKQKVNDIWFRAGPVSDRAIEAALHFPTLKYLSLRQSEITEAQLGKLATLPQIEGINLQASTITDNGLRYLGALRSLRKLNLSGTEITGTAFSAFSSMKQLEEIDLSETRLTDEGVRCLAPLKGLRVLNLGRTGISGAGFCSFGTAPALERLELYETNLSDAHANCLSAFTSLRVLNVDSTKIAGNALLQFSSLTALDTLSLYHDEIDDESLRHLTHLSNLTMLRLGGTRITDSGLTYLNQVKSLRHVVLMDTVGVTAEGVAQLRGLRPNLDIRWSPRVQVEDGKECEGERAIRWCARNEFAQTRGKGPLQLAWMVNKRLRSKTISFTVRTSRMGPKVSRVLRLAHHLFHHPDKLDGVKTRNITVDGLPVRGDYFICPGTRSPRPTGTFRMRDWRRGIVPRQG